MGNLRKLLSAIVMERRKRLSGFTEPAPIYNTVFQKRGLEISLATVEDRFKIVLSANESLGARIDLLKYDGGREVSNESPDFSAGDIATIGLELLMLSSAWLDDGRYDFKNFEDTVRRWRNSKLTTEDEKPRGLDESHMLRSLGKVGDERSRDG